MVWPLLARGFLVAALVVSAAVLRPWSAGGTFANAGIGLAAGILGILAELRLTTVPLRPVIGGLLGSLAGLLLGALFGQALLWLFPHDSTAFIATVVVLLPAYLGAMTGVRLAGWFDPVKIAAAFRAAPPDRRYKILDTSVIIDGRIADVCETGFVDGTLVVPQFVLKELQFVADSSDALKRNRGRRGLDILARIQKMASVEVLVSDTDFPAVREVDLKLIELARTLKGKIVTNDFNLNKVAQLRGIDVLNINELANALKPVVLPGEFMKVFILKEGKEYNQGVAYLDDGTMVVVDNARRLIGKTIDVVVTSVLQTTAGKMIFGRHIEPASPPPAPAEVAGVPAPAVTSTTAGDKDDAAKRTRPVPPA